MRVKICGITDVADAMAAAQAGADAIGLNFVGGPRRIDPTRGAEILRHLPPMVTPVALVRIGRGLAADPPVELLTEFRVSHLQVYGDVTSVSLGPLIREGFRPVPVIAVKDERFTDQAESWLAGGPDRRPYAIVLDAFDPDREGGTGKALRWDLVSAAREEGRLSDWPQIILAGGLNPANVAEAIRIVQPYAVDVSSGVELEGSPGKKDPDKMRAFVRNAKNERTS